jgi:hypothetical protein
MLSQMNFESSYFATFVGTQWIKQGQLLRGRFSLPE